MIFHRHKWGEVGRVFCRPRASALELSYADDVTMLRYVAGFTVIEEACECGQVREAMLTGNHVDSMDPAP